MYVQDKINPDYTCADTDSTFVMFPCRQTNTQLV